jgi:16S rRNA (cytosine1402-N4)-methyltransferase
MPDEVCQWLTPIAPRVVVDGTYGAGGHSRRLLAHLADDGILIAIDRDPAVLARVEAAAGESAAGEAAAGGIECADPRLQVFLGSYEQTGKALASCQLEFADAMVLDLGLSSDQLDDRKRGFSFLSDGPLDLRFDPETGIPANEWLRRSNEKEIADTIYRFGDERFSRRIAREIVSRARAQHPVGTVADLVDVCRRCVPRSKNHDIHPATRTFQALRIAINDELGHLTRTLEQAPDWIRPGGRLVVISFHSLEDRIVKRAFRDDDRWQPLTKKPQLPSPAEVDLNPRSRSAKLRVAERTEN